MKSDVFHYILINMHFYNNFNPLLTGKLRLSVHHRGELGLAGYLESEYFSGTRCANSPR